MNALHPRVKCFHKSEEEIMTKRVGVLLIWAGVLDVIHLVWQNCH